MEAQSSKSLWGLISLDLMIESLVDICSGLFRHMPYCALNFTMSLCSICTEALRKDKYTKVSHHASWISFRASLYAQCPVCWSLWQGIRASPFDAIPEDVQEWLSTLTMIHPWCFVSSCGGRQMQGHVRLELNHDSENDFDKTHREDGLVAGEVWSQETLSRIRFWVDHCLSSHEVCAQRAGKPYLPKRLLDLGARGSKSWKLVRRDQIMSEDTQYAALSHRWTSTIPKLQDESLDSMSSETLDEILPKHYQDVLKLVRLLGLRFIWIDSMCIKQDSQQDWIHEAAAMIDVYKNAWCTFAILWHSESEGCVPSTSFRAMSLSSEKGTRCARLVKFLKKMKFARQQQASTKVLVSMAWDNFVARSPLNQRGWVLQESSLSPRIIYMGNEQLIWVCDETTAAEKVPGSAIQLELTHSRTWKGGQDYQRSSQVWLDIVQRYSGMELTFESDRLVAVSGIARLLASELDDEYLAGLWRHSLMDDLLWTATPFHEENTVPRLEARDFVAPTWSWASCNQPVGYHRQRGSGSLAVAYLDRSVIKPKGGALGDVFGQLESACIELSCFQVKLTLVRDGRKPWLSAHFAQNPRNIVTEDYQPKFPWREPFRADTTTRYEQALVTGNECSYLPLVFFHDRPNERISLGGVVVCRVSSHDAKAERPIYQRVGVLTVSEQYDTSAHLYNCVDSFSPMLRSLTTYIQHYPRPVDESAQSARASAFQTINDIILQPEVIKGLTLLDQDNPHYAKSRKVAWGNIVLV